jgi:hypothetical protein
MPEKIKLEMALPPTAALCNGEVQLMGEMFLTNFVKGNVDRSSFEFPQLHKSRH